MSTRLITIRAGESIFIDFQKQGGTTIDTTMAASYSIEDSLGVEVASGTLDKSVDEFTFELRIESTETTSFTVAEYLLLVKAFDSTSGYADYIFEETVRVYD